MPFTAKEIEEMKEDHRSLVGWVKELCWQVAKWNEFWTSKHPADGELIAVGDPRVMETILNQSRPHLTEDRIDGQVKSATDGIRQKRKYVRKAKIA